MSGAAVVIGRIGRPHGVRGLVRARATGPTLSRLAPGERLMLRPAEGAPRPAVLAGLSGTDERPILALEGISSREQAAALAGALIEVPEARIGSAPSPDTYYVRDLVGCAVLIGGRPAGTVSDVIAAPANDVIEVDTGEGPLLVPFTADAVLELDLVARRIVVRDDLFGSVREDRP